MQELVKNVEDLKNSEIKVLVGKRIKEFESVKDIFSELSFCILTANFNAERAIKIQNEIKDGFLSYSEEKLEKELRRLGYRFPKLRSSFIVKARDYEFKRFKNGFEFREDLVKNVKGLGYKESSHFLRNTGYKDVAIIDFHIVDLLVKHSIIENPRTLTKKKYLDIEDILRKISKKLDLNLAELDLYLWFLETGKVLK